MRFERLTVATVGYDAVSSNRHVQMFMRVRLPPLSGYKLGRSMYLWNSTPFYQTTGYHILSDQSSN